MLLFGIGHLPGCEDAPQEKQAVLSEEERLAAILSEIEGAGTVKVLLTYADNGELFPVYDAEGDPVVLSQEGEALAATRKKTATVGGVLLVAEGADKSEVRASLVAAVRALYGTDYERISVIKGKRKDD